MAEFVDRFWSSRDGLKLHYRDYAGRDDRPPLVCLPGLTRNARDFAELADRLAGEWRVLCPELRGRGDSAYAKDSSSYNPQQYLEDLGALFEEAGVTRFVSIGTSLGALLTMMIGLAMPGVLAGAVLNDAGPELGQAGIERIRGYVGQGRSFPTWMHAARALEEVHGHAFPNAGVADWLAAAKRVMTLSSNGRIVFDYDMKIAEPFMTADFSQLPQVLWPGFESLASIPVLIVRGALSEVLSAQTLVEMQRRMPSADVVTVEGVGHAPTLGEPEAAAAIDRLLSRIA